MLIAKEQQFYHINHHQVIELFKNNKFNFKLLNTPTWNGKKDNVLIQNTPGECIENLCQGVNEILNILAAKEKIDQIFWMDTSSRPLRRIVINVYQKLYPQLSKPLENFINIGTTTNAEDFNKLKYYKEIEMLQKATYLSNCNHFHPRSILIADHYVDTGRSLCHAHDLFTNLQIPLSNVYLFGGCKRDDIWFTQPEFSGLKNTPEGKHRPLFLNRNYVVLKENKEKFYNMFHDMNLLADFMVRSATPTTPPESLNLLDINALKHGQKLRVTL